MKIKSKFSVFVISITIFVIIVIGISTQQDSDSFSRYDSFPSTCDSLLGNPDADCFVKAFEECETATIKNMSTTVEGDPIFFYAQIILTGDCKIFFEVDDSLDYYGHNSLLNGIMCFDVRVSDNKQYLEFLCGDNDDEWYGFTLY